MASAPTPTTRTTNDIIVRALYLAGVYGPEDSNPRGYDIVEGVELLNDLLDNFSSAGIYIPTTTTINFTVEAGKHIYRLFPDPSADINSNLIVDLQWCSLTSDNIKRFIRVADDGELLRTTHLAEDGVNGIRAWPRLVRFQKFVNETLLLFYYAPDRDYECEILCRVQLNHLVLEDPVFQVPTHYHRFLKYALARELTDIHKTARWSTKSENEYQEMYDRLKAANKVDVELRTSSILLGTGGDSTHRGNILV